MLALAWAFSRNRRAFPVRVVAWGMGLQLIFAILILRTPVGSVLRSAADKLTSVFLAISNEGATLVFGAIASEELMSGEFGAANAVVLAIRITATIIVVASLASLFYHWGVLQKLVQAMAWVMRRSMRTSGSESLSAAANIFMGQTEAPLLVKPYLERMTRSELLSMMTGGMATIAGSMLTVYVSFGLDAGDLFTASIMSAPGALLIAKIMMPEAEVSETAIGASVDVGRTDTNSVDALCRGASDGMKLAINVIAMLIAFTAVVALVNHLLGVVFGEALTLQTMLGWVNVPFAWLMGVPASDCLLVGQALGERIILNEFVGYLTIVDAGEELSQRGRTLATYALCGFANFGSIAIQIGGIGALVPGQRTNLAALGVRAMIAGILTCYLTASIVGLLM